MTAETERHIAKAGGTGMSDHVECSCGWKSNSYFDGREWAMQEWNDHATRPSPDQSNTLVSGDVVEAVARAIFDEICTGVHSPIAREQYARQRRYKEAARAALAACRYAELVEGLRRISTLSDDEHPQREARRILSNIGANRDE